MSDKSAIEWTDATWNPIVGCSIVSPGCTNCYAMKMAGRIEKMNPTGGSNSNYVNHYDGTTKGSKAGAVWTGKVALAPDKLFLKPLSWKQPRRIFVNSMGDLFHESIPDEWIDRVFAVMALCPQHTFQVLTKRAERMRTYLSARNGMGNAALCDAINAIPAHMGNRHGALQMPLPNVWLGVSTERQQEADERIPLLLDTPAAVRFISAEPLLGPINLNRLCILPQREGSTRAGIHVNALAGRYCESGMPYLGDWDVRGPCPPASEQRRLDWVIVGGESGHGARPMHPDWARSLRDQCAAANVPFFFKQWGEFAPYQAGVGPMSIERVCINDKFYGGHCFGDGWFAARTGKKIAGRLLDSKEHNAFPQAKEVVFE